MAISLLIGTTQRRLFFEPRTHAACGKLSRMRSKANVPRETLVSGDYINIASLLAKRVWGILQERSMEPPLKIHATGADDNTILDLTVGEDFTLESTTSAECLNAKLPIIATITDLSGNCREITITQDASVQ